MPSRLSNCLLFLSFCIHAFGTLAVAEEIATKNRPNFLFIFADDMCFDAIAELGHEEVKTPNLDRLARTGTSFRNAYNMGGWNGAICIASRTMLNTGRFIWRAKNTKFKQFMAEQNSWSQILGKAGYETYMSGKWHVGGLKTKQIFNHVLHERPGMPNQTKEGYVRPIDGKPDVWSPSDPKFGGFWKGGKHWSEVLADDATEFLESAAEGEKPFFMYLAFNAPHDPRQAPQDFVDMYPPSKIQLPVNFLPEYPFKQEMGCYEIGKRKKDGKLSILRDENLAPFPRTKHAVQVNRQEYFAIISHMDQQIGRILKALAASGKKDNTYILFSADHGLACGQHGLLGKQNMYEHSMKAPLIVAGPDFPHGQTREQFTYVQDVMPTTLELAGIQQPDHVEFHSLVNRIEDKDYASPYPAIYGAYQKNLQRMIRLGDYKLILYPKGSITRLFNVAEDPYETKDLANAAEHASRKQEMFRKLLELCENMDDEIDLKAAFPEFNAN